jgi:hypothetical protein
MADEFDVDEWDPSRGTLAEHIVAGSSAGLAEHLVMFPVDTIKVRRVWRARAARERARSPGPRALTARWALPLFRCDRARPPAIRL